MMNILDLADFYIVRSGASQLQSIHKIIIMNQLAGYIGKKTITTVSHIFNLFVFAHRLVSLAFKRPTHGRAVIRRAIVEQVYFTGVEALPIIIPVALIVGSILISRFSWMSGQYELGKVVVIIVVRELAPIITALVVILRSATAVTIEISYMNIFNEIDTIEMSGIDPMWVISLPRLVGITSAILCLFIVFDLVSIIGGYGIVWAVTYIPMGNFFGQIGKAITIADIVVGIFKALCFGIVITVVALYYGFGTKRQMTQIPQVTSRAAIECFVYCLVISIVISAIFYL